MEEPATQVGTVTRIYDAGSVVQVFIETDDGTWPYAADGNSWRRSGAADNILVGDRVSFIVNEWGGLESIQGE